MSLKTKVISSTFLLSSLFASQLSANSLNEDVALAEAIEVAAQNGWQLCHSSLGNCQLAFPKTPDRLADKMQNKGGKMEVNYDAFVTSPDAKTTYMLLVTKYPEFVDESYAKIGLEGFLNGLINRSVSNELLSAQMTFVEGNEALDFLIKAGTQFFKGRAIILKNHLYLMAMECEIPSYNHENYERFIGSFQLKGAAAK